MVHSAAPVANAGATFKKTMANYKNKLKKGDRVVIKDDISGEVEFGKVLSFRNDGEAVEVLWDDLLESVWHDMAEEHLISKDETREN